MKTYSFKGGVIIKNQFDATKNPVVKVDLPEKVVIPLTNNIEKSIKLLKNIGDKVKTGEIIANNDGKYCVPIHATISGEITNIEEKTLVNKYGDKTKCICITISSDGKDDWIKNKGCGKDFTKCSKEKIIEHIHKSGIVGLGGAGFPTHIKIKNLKNCHTVIVNATECEPDISCDDMLIQNYPNEVIHATKILLHITNAKKAYIAIEDDKPKAFTKLKNANNDDRIEVVKIPKKYTSGSDKILTKSLLNIELPKNKYLSDIGILCQNVATVKAIYDAVINNRPLISRMVTVTGNGVKTPQNYDVRLGYDLQTLINLSEELPGEKDIRIGGLMMGIDVNNTKMPITKVTNCIFVNKKQFKQKANECIRCGKCNAVCPINLLPQQLYWYAQAANIDKTIEYNLLECFECNCCSYACPSNIDLVDYFIKAKKIYQNQIIEKNKSIIAKQRFEFRNYRLQRDKEERAKMLEEKRMLIKAKLSKKDKDKIKTTMLKTKNNNANK